MTADKSEVDQTIVSVIDQFYYISMKSSVNVIFHKIEILLNSLKIKISFTLYIAGKCDLSPDLSSCSISSILKQKKNPKF